MKTVICLGDSLTGPGPAVVYLDKYVKWSDLLQIGLDAVFGSGAVNVLNQGLAGEKSAGLLAALDERLIARKPDVVVLMIGANNFGKCDDLTAALDTFHIDLTEIVTRAKSAGIRVLLLQYPKPLADDMSRVWSYGDAGNGVIAAVAREQDVASLDLAPVFAFAAAKHPLATLTNPVDGIHLNPGGELVLAGAVLEHLRALDWPIVWPGRTV